MNLIVKEEQAYFGTFMMTGIETLGSIIETSGCFVTLYLRGY